METPFLSIIIPAYNEAQRISNTLESIQAFLEKVSYVSELIVVSDGSKDKTVAIVRDFSSRIRNLRVIENSENHGKGWVTKQGMLEAKGKWRIFMDADNSTSIAEFEKFQPFIEQGYEVLIASRGIKGAELHPPQPWYRRVPGKIGNFIIQLILLPGIWDTQCGFKCFSSRATEIIFPNMKIDHWGFDVEALALARRSGFRIKEIPVLWRNDTRSTLGAGAYISTLIDVVKIRWNFISGKYGKK